MTGSLVFHAPELAQDGDAYILWRAHCGECELCVAGLESWCPRYESPRAGDPRWGEPFRTHSPGASARSVSCSAIVLDLIDAWDESEPTVLIVGAGDDSPHVVTMLEQCGIQVAAEPRIEGTRLSETTRKELSSFSPSGRADVAVTFGAELAVCARWVRRSGAVATVDPSAPEPDLDSLTMRELTILSPRRPYHWIEKVAVR